MKRAILTLLIATLSIAAMPSLAQAAFGVQEFDLGFTAEGGAVPTQAGAHPLAVVTKIQFNGKPGPFGPEVPDGVIRDLDVSLPPGLVGRPNSVPRCPEVDFRFVSGEPPVPNCANGTAVGVAITKGIYYSNQGPLYVSSPVYNLPAAPGTVQKVGFVVQGLVPVIINFVVNPEPPYNVVAKLDNVTQLIPFFGSKLFLWGNPANPIHDSERGNCISSFEGPEEEKLSTVPGCSNPASTNEEPYITLPTSCDGPTPSDYFATSAEGSSDAGHFDGAQLTGCERLRFTPTTTATPTTKAAESPTGLDFSLDVKDEGLTNSAGLAQSNIKKAVVTLPEGMSTNPSLAEGLNVCTEADLDRESVYSEPGAGCPNESKIGRVELETPLLDEPVNGSLFIAKPYDNPSGSLLALYMVIKNPQLGIIVKQAFKVENDPVTGRITTVAEDIPQLPFSHFNLHFREGTRSPLASPQLCGAYNASAVLTPWSGGPPITTDSAFTIISGPNASGCPSGTSQPFKPELLAGTINNAGGTYSPFNTRITRDDGEQEITNFSIKLPPGVAGKLAGIPFCSDASIAAAKARTGPHGGEEEINSPSCPKASEVGRSLAGAGVGPSLAYAPGKLYLAGPYKGSSLSLVSVTAAKVGPFDLGNVVVRFALKINPETAEVFIDATGSDPIPHIIKGIPLHLRDVRAYVDRPEFVLNPTSCARTSTASTILGSGSDFGSSSDDVPVTVTSPFQAADCASLGFKPKLALTLKGGTKRGDNPAFKATLTARKGDANIGKAQVTLPHSEFLDQSHIKTICTRAQFKAGVTPGEKCPAASVYGYARAITPLLDEPLQGPVYLRSSSNPLPDLVAALNSGKIDIALAGRIDSVQGGRIRTTFAAVPDAPVTRFTLEMKGGKKGLLVNSTNLCKRANRAIADFTGQNGKKHVLNPVLKAQGCKGAKKAKGKKKSQPQPQAKRPALLAW